MIPFKKLASLFIRTFSKPLSNYIKRYALNNNQKRSLGQRICKNTFIFLGNKYHQFDFFINRASLGNQNIFIKPLADDAAFIKGTDFFSEMFIYFCVLGLPLFEMMRQSSEAEKKQSQQNQKLENLEERLLELKQQEHKVFQILEQIKSLDEQIKNSLNFTANEFEIKLNSV